MNKHKYNGVQAAMFDEFVTLLDRAADEGYHVVGCGRELGQWWALMEHDGSIAPTGNGMGPAELDALVERAVRRALA